jgi:ATP-dependent RNA helicase RhlE
MPFSSMGLSPVLLRAIAEQNYDTPTPIQVQAIPAVLTGRDLLAAAQTGTGKTAAFTLPLLQRLLNGAPGAPAKSSGRAPRVLVLTPTRELAAQVSASISLYGQHTPIRCTVVFGGVGIQPQVEALRRGIDILVATPGRLLDLVAQGCANLSAVESLVLDEADRMLDMGFIRDIRRVLALLPRTRQNLLFSATFSDDIRALAKGLLHDPLVIEVARRNAPAESVSQRVYQIDKSFKPTLLAHLMRSGDWGQTLVFTRTKHGANRLAQQLERNGFRVGVIHGNKSQSARTRALDDFKQDRLQILVATDIAARGLDIHTLPHVVNYELPNVPEDYVHRIGRTGRAGRSGEAVSLVCADEALLLKGVERLLGRRLPVHTAEGWVASAPEPPHTPIRAPVGASAGRAPPAPRHPSPNPAPRREAPRRRAR